jgi:hypothetical protein
MAYNSSCDFDFQYAVKPCDNAEKCIEQSKMNCPYFNMCDLAIKNPSETPTIDWRIVTKL